MQKAKEEAIEVEGRVKQALANTTFRVELDIGGEVIATSVGKTAKNTISKSSRETGSSWKYRLTI